MKQPYPIMRLFAVFLIVVIACCIHSCKKDNQHNEGHIITTDNTVAEIKEWLSIQKDDSVAVQKIIISAQWDKARSIGADSSVYQLVPLSTTNVAKFEVDKKIQRYLVLQRQQGAVTGGYIYEMFGSSDDLLKNENELIAGFASKKLNFAFTGNLAKFTLNGEFDEANIYQNGMLLQYRKLYKTNTNASKAIQTTDKKIAGLRCTDWYLVTEYSDGTVTSEYLGRTCYCDDQQQSTAIRDNKGSMTIKLACADGGGGSSDPGGDGPCPPQTSQSVKNNKVVLTVKLSSCDIVVVPPKIINIVKDPCLRKMVDASINNDVQYRINESMNSIFDQNTNFNITFKDDVSSSFPEPDDSGITNVTNSTTTTLPNGRLYTSTMDIEITLNSTELANASKEYITATIMHEALHAYLTYSHTLLNQHLDMATNYLSSMQSQLLSMYPNLSEANAHLLVWGGLEKDSLGLYSNLSQAEKSLIEITNRNYKDGTEGQPCTP